MAPTEQKVLIIGAGPAGACLAQILRKNGIAYEIFDRDSDLQSESRAGGGFLLDGCLPDLDELLPSDLGDWNIASVNFATGKPDELAYVDGKSGEVRLKLSGISKTGRPTAIIAHRQKFRNYLVQHLDLQINKQFERYEEDDDGVTAFFKDGSSARGTILVAADGGASKVRNQLLDNPETSLHPMVPITGEVTMAGKQLQQLQEISNSGMIAVTADTHMGLMQLAADPDGLESVWFWLAVFKSEDAAADTAWVRAASKQTLYKKALSLSAGFPELMRDAIRRGGPAGVRDWQIRLTEFVPPSKLPRGRVTLMGDAAHNTTPFRGMGANVSLRDACDLGRLLVSEKWDTFGGIETVLSKYEKVMIPRGQDCVLKARAYGLRSEAELSAPMDEGGIGDRAATVVHFDTPIRLDLSAPAPSRAPSEVEVR